jgi:hypothetical protein
MDNKTQSNNTSSWGIHFNREKDMRYPPVPQWVKAGNRMAWENSGVIVWSETADRVMCLLPHQALDVLDDLRESSDWKDSPFCLEWESYSIPFSEENRVEWRTTKNRRSPTLKNNTGYGGIILTPEQTQELFLFLEQHQTEIREFADIRAKEVRKILGRAYTMILGWGRDRRKKQQGNSDN